MGAVAGQESGFMAHSFPQLFSPLRIGNYTLKNRIMNTGHAAHFQTGDGLPTERYVDYVRERAKGGAGIIVTGHTVPHYDGAAALSLANYDDRIVPIYDRFAEAAHAYEVPVLAQLGHRGRRTADAVAYLGRPNKAPSTVPAPDFSAPQLPPHAMTTEEVEETVQLFAAAARRVKRGSMDGIELAVGMDNLFANFLNPSVNSRDDRYGGGDLEERMSFMFEVVEAVRGELGADLLLGVRFYDDLVDYSLGLEDYKMVARLLEGTGSIDYFNMWQGIVASPKSGRAHWPAHYYEPGQFAHLPAGLKEVVSLPVVGAGRIDSPALAERLIEQGALDVVGMARALIADPHLPNKVKEGRTDDIRTCIACTQSCVGHIYLGMGVGCIYNPVTGREREWAELTPATKSKKVVVVGGGPAGMETARIAAERGHQVVLFERNRRLGGQINLVMRTPARDNFEEIILFFERQLAKLAVDVRLGTQVAADQVLASAREAIQDPAQVGERVLVVDTLGRAEAPTTAEFLVDQGRQVEIITGLEYVGREMRYPAWHHLIERLMTKNVKLTAFTGLWEVLEDSVDVYNVITWEPRSIEGIDTVVLAAGGEAADGLYRDLKGRVADLHLIGDSFQPRDIELAVVDGHRVAREI
jgi:2,4-dienoyl-CoA reductase-like NADH-dependent reductase (Old Yellow Enzyme family)